MNPWAIAIGAALGELKSRQDEKIANEQRKTEAMKTRWATFTGQHGQNVPGVNHLNGVMQGAMTGAMVGQAMGGGEAAAAGDPAAAQASGGMTQRNNYADPNAWRTGA